MSTRYTVQFKNQPKGARASGIEANSAAEAIAQAGKLLGCLIDPGSPWDQSFLLEAIPQTATIIAFNTCRTYTQYGQRIAATKLESGHIVMVDIDRGIDLMFCADFDLTEQDVMRAYDWDICTYPSEIGLSYEDYYKLLPQLRQAAAAL